MSINPMRNSHQSDQTIHRLETGRVLRIEPSNGNRRLRVLRGAVWITAGGPEQTPSGDIWLMPGDEWVLPAGVDALLEGWPKASVEEVAVAAAVKRSPMAAAMTSFQSAVAARLGFEVRRGARLVGIEGPVRMARRGLRMKGRRHAETDWGGLYNAGVPRSEG
ncbi:MAG: hypothetical protein JWQ11_2100 [Rhizobacter sp.]|nr:hypothetical protein [Rhizobacter sp.]